VKFFIVADRILGIGILFIIVILLAMGFLFWSTTPSSFYDTESQRFLGNYFPGGVMLLLFVIALIMFVLQRVIRFMHNAQVRKAKAKECKKMG